MQERNNKMAQDDYAKVDLDPFLEALGTSKMMKRLLQ
jgi:hypothetical protein